MLSDPLIAQYAVSEVLNVLVNKPTYGSSFPIISRHFPVVRIIDNDRIIIYDPSEYWSFIIRDSTLSYLSYLSYLILLILPYPTLPYLTLSYPILLYPTHLPIASLLYYRVRCTPFANPKNDGSSKYNAMRRKPPRINSFRYRIRQMWITLLISPRYSPFSRVEIQAGTRFICMGTSRGSLPGAK